MLLLLDHATSSKFSQALKSAGTNRKPAITFTANTTGATPAQPLGVVEPSISEPTWSAIGELTWMPAVGERSCALF
jgi:hypothetical protein